MSEQTSCQLEKIYLNIWSCKSNIKHLLIFFLKTSTSCETVSTYRSMLRILWIRFEKFHFKVIGTVLPRSVMAGWTGFFGAVISRTPSDDRFEETCSGWQPSGRLYFRTNCRETNLKFTKFNLKSVRILFRVFLRYSKSSFLINPFYSCSSLVNTVPFL